MNQATPREWGAGPALASPRLYLEVARRSFQRNLAYRSAALAGIFTNTIFGVVIASSYLALYRSRGAQPGTVAGFDTTGILTFVWLGQALIGPVAMWGSWEIAETIRTGDVVSDLMKPLDFYAFWLSRDLGRAFCQLFFRFLPSLVVGGLLYDLALPGSVGHWLVFGLSLWLAVVLSFGIRFLSNIMAFWLIDLKGVSYVHYFAVTFLGGMLVPITFFPGWLRVAAELLPFRAVVMTPIQVALGQVAFGPALALQAGWVVALVLLGRWMLGRAVRKLEVQGG